MENNGTNIEIKREIFTIGTLMAEDARKSTSGICLRTRSKISYWDGERVLACSCEMAATERAERCNSCSSDKTLKTLGCMQVTASGVNPEIASLLAPRQSDSLSPAAIIPNVEK